MIRLFALLFLAVSCGDSELLVEEDGVQAYEHRIFVTEGLYPASFQRLSQADDYCQDEARVAGLKRSYKAIISGSNTSAKNRLTLYSGVYNVDRNGILVKVVDSAPRLWDTFSFRLLAPVIFDARGEERSGFVWTGSHSEGSLAIEHCSNWASASSSIRAAIGSVGAINNEWLEYYPSGHCNEPKRFYCISQ